MKYVGSMSVSICIHAHTHAHTHTESVYVYVFPVYVSLYVYFQTHAHTRIHMHLFLKDICKFRFKLGFCVQGLGSFAQLLDPAADVLEAREAFARPHQAYRFRCRKLARAV